MYIKNEMLPFVVSIVFSCAVLADTPHSSSDKSAIEAALLLQQAAIIAPDYEPAFSAFKNSITYSDTDFYVVEGDLMIKNDDELRKYLFSKQAETNVDSLGEIGFSLDASGNRLTWPEKYDFVRYYINSDSFRNKKDYVVVRDAFHKASESWNEICDVCRAKFIEGTPDGYDVLVEYKLILNGAYAVVEHFDTEFRKKIYVSRKYFSKYNKYSKEGILRHELGHVLGYAHEQYRVKTTGCYFINSRYVPISEEHDPGSVMHSPCGRKSSNFTYDLTATDISGHICAYGTSKCL